MSSLQPGQLFAQDFAIERRLAEGGMGAVYVARQLSTDKLRALKLMHPQLAPDARSRQRFVDEARVGGRIDSEHVVEVVAAGVDEASGAPWLAMELLDGEDLGSLSARRGALPAGEVRDVFLQAGHALALAHDKGIVHRDLKPENLFLARARREGAGLTVKVLDFGIAMALPTGGAGVVTTTVGSPFWMAPEQARPGSTLTPGTDVWALGLIAFQLLSGGSYWRTARQNDVSIGAVLTEILVDPLEPASERATRLGLRALPEGFDAWFARCVTREAGERFPDARACLTALDELLSRVAPRTLVAASRSLKETAPSLGLDATHQRATPAPIALEPASESIAHASTHAVAASASSRAGADAPPAPAGANAPESAEASGVAPPAVGSRGAAVPSPHAGAASPAPSPRGGRLWWVAAVSVALLALWGLNRTLSTPEISAPPAATPLPQKQPDPQPGTPQQPATPQPALQQEPLPQPGAALPAPAQPDERAPTDPPPAPPARTGVEPPAPPAPQLPKKTRGPRLTAPAAELAAERVKGETCPGAHITVAEARANVERFCALLDPWEIVRLAGGGSMDGPGYQCKVRERDPRGLGASLCRR